MSSIYMMVNVFIMIGSIMAFITREPVSMELSKGKKNQKRVEELYRRVLGVCGGIGTVASVVMFVAGRFIFK